MPRASLPSDGVREAREAYKLRNVASDVDDVITHHVGFEAFVNGFLRSPTMLDEFRGQDARHRAVCRDAKLLAREIEKLAPAVDRAQAPENAEYPWERGVEPGPLWLSDCA